MVESGLHRLDLLELVFNGVDIFFFEYLCVYSAFVGVCRINVPCTEHDVVKFCNGNDFVIFEIFLVGAFAYTHFIILGH